MLSQISIGQWIGAGLILLILCSPFLAVFLFAVWVAATEWGPHMYDYISEFYQTHKLAITLAMLITGVWIGFGLCVWGG